MENLRAQIETDLYESIEGEWKVEAELTSPDGVTQIYSKNNPTEKLGGQVLYFTRSLNPETGEAIIVNEPVLTLRISSLDRVPANGENWFVRMPTSPQAGAPKENFVFTSDRAKNAGTDIGFIRMYLQRADERTSPTS